MKTVLIIDDDQTLQKLYTNRFTKSGYSALSAHTGKDGLRVAEEKHPDIILLDVMLQGPINGFDVLEKLKHDEAVSDIPVLVCTNLDSERKTAMDMGAQAYVVKASTTLDELVEKVEDVTKQLVEDENPA